MKEDLHSLLRMYYNMILILKKKSINDYRKLLYNEIGILLFIKEVL